MHRIVTKVKALLIRSGWAFAPSYISVESRNYSVIIVKAIQSSFPLDPAILNARIYLIYRIFIFVTRRGGKKIFYLSAIKVLARNLKYAVDFSLFFFLFTVNSISGNAQNWSWNRVAEFSRDKRNFLTSFPRSPLRSYVLVGRRVIFGPPPVGSRACSHVTRS